MTEPLKSPAFEDVLERRARELAETVKLIEEGETFSTIAVLAVGATNLGLPVDHLKEVVPRTAVTSLPGLPPWFSGVAQVRGVLMSVVHLGRWLGLAGMDAGPFFAVLDGSRGPLALEVDAVAGFRAVRTDEIAKDLEEVTLKAAGLVRAATRDLVLILDPSALLGHKDIDIETVAAGRKESGLRPGRPGRKEES